MSQTRSRSKATATVTPQQDDSVAVTWVFFDASRPNNNPLPINVPRSLFNGNAHACRGFFAAALWDEFAFKAQKRTIAFWKPIEQLLASTAFNPGWTEGIGNNKFRDYFKGILLSSSFAKNLALDNDEALHMIITAKGIYQDPAEEQEEVDDIATALPEIRRYKTIVSTPGKSPSDGAKSKEYVSVQGRLYEAIHDGRCPPNPPFSTVAPPVEIFHPVFEKFHRLVNDPSFKPTDEAVILTQELMHVLSAIGTSESQRNPEIRKKLSEIMGLDIRVESNNDGTSADGVVIYIVNNIHIPLLIAEFKREMGDGGCDPSTQAGMTMRRSWIQADRADIRDKCCCPTLMLAGGGPWLCVLGGVFTDKVIVQRLTDMMWVGHSSTEEDARVYGFARVLRTLRECLLELQDFYNTIGAADHFSFAPGLSPPRFYPYPTSYFANGKLVSFHYTRMLEDDAACVTFQAKICDEVDSPDIVVKFVTRYGKQVQELLANHGHAPKLRYCGRLPGDSNLPSDETPSESPAHPLSDPNQPPGLSFGPMQMIVMDYISSCAKPPTDARQQLQAILEMLHSKGYVLGDLRRQNVLFDKENKAKIIDLDWSGRYDMNICDDSLPAALKKKIDDSKECIQQGDGHYVYYPLNLSRRIAWAAGVKDLAPIRPQHDWAMLAAMSLEV